MNQEIAKSKGMSPVAKTLILTGLIVFGAVLGGNYVYDKYIPKPVPKA